MAKIDSLKNAVLDAMAEFYQEYIKPETRQMVEQVLEQKLDKKLDEKLDEKLGPLKASVIRIEDTINVALSEDKGQQIRLADHERRISKLESRAQPKF